MGGLNGADIEFIDPSTNDGEYGIVAVHLTTPTGSVVLDLQFHNGLLIQ